VVDTLKRREIIIPAKKKGEVSQRRESEARKELKESIGLLIKTRKNLTAKVNKGETLRDQELRFLEHYPDILRNLRERQVEVKEEVLPEGKLKEFIDRVWRLKDIGKLEDVIEATGYYRCNNCGELHVLDRECMYNEFNKNKGESKDNEVTNK